MAIASDCTPLQNELMPRVPALSKLSRQGGSVVRREDLRHGFMQVRRGKTAPLARLKLGDGVAYY
jgi:hypothetical protein